MKHLRIIMGFFLLSCPLIYAQETLPSDSLKRSDPYRHYKDQSAIGLNLSTTGFGLQYIRNVNRHFNVKLKGNYFGLPESNQTVTQDTHEVNVFSDAEIANIDVIAEYLPFHNSQFKINGGFAYFISLDPSAKVTYAGEISYGDIILSTEDIGEVLVDISWVGLAPYMGIGFGRDIPKNKFGFSVDLGTYYIGAPDIDLVASDLLSNNEQEEAQLAENLDGYRWLPYLNFGISLKL